jgi:hypothetical protein
MNKLFRFLFLAKEIRSNTGELHFQRWRILWTPLFALYIHHIAKSDEDKHPHSHPFGFYSVILKGGYSEELTSKVGFIEGMALAFFHDFRSYKTESGVYKPFSFLSRNCYVFHKITILKPTWTFVIAGRRVHDWGYLVNNEVVPHGQYRKNKNEGMYANEQ